MTGTDKNVSRSWLFTNQDDMRGNLWSKVAMDQNFNAMDTQGTLLENILMAKYYDNKRNDMNDNDIHWEVTDMVVLAAYYHRELDKPSVPGSKLVHIKEAINDYLDDHYDTIMDNIVTFINADIYKEAREKLRDNLQNVNELANSIANDNERYIISSVDGLVDTKIITSGNNSSILDLLKDKFNILNDNQLNNMVDQLQVKFMQNVTLIISGALRRMAMGNNFLVNKDDVQESSEVLMTKNAFVNDLFDVIKQTVLPLYASHNNDLTKTVPKSIYQNVYLRWNDMDEQTKKFYEKFLNLLQRNADGTESPVDESNYANPISDDQLTNYRFNLKKIESGSDVTVFENSLPKLPSYTNLWYTDKNGEKKYISNVQLNVRVNVLRLIYHNIYNNIDIYDDMDIVKNWESAKSLLTVPYFNITGKVDKIIKERFFRLSKAKFVDIPEAEEEAEEATKAYNYISLIDKGIWRRNYQGEYFKNVGGKEVRYNADDSETKKLFQAKNMCYSTMVNDESIQKCREEYIMGCLLNDDAKSLENCIKKLKRTTQWIEKVKNEINNIHPLVAVRTLQKFGFKTSTVNDEQAGMQLVKVDNVERWLKDTIKDTLKDNPQQMMAILENDILLQYLQLLSDYVNGNPGILNRGYGGTSEEAVGMLKESSLIRALGIPARKEPSRKEEVRYELGLLKNNFNTNYIGTLLKMQKNPFFVTMNDKVYSPFGNAIHPGVRVLVPAAQRGGNNDKMQWVLRKMNNETGTTSVVGAKLIKEIFNQTVQELNARNKHLHEKDLENIQKRLNNMVKQEEELLRTVYYIDEYNKLLDSLRDYNPKTLNIEGLKNLVERHSKLHTRYYDSGKTLVQILEQIQKLLGEEDNKSRKTISLD